MMYEMVGYTEEYQELMEKILLRAGFAISKSTQGNTCFEGLGGLEDEEILRRLRDFDII